MRDEPLWEISVKVSKETEAAVVRLMERVFSQSASVYSQAEPPAIWVSVYAAGFAAVSQPRLARLSEGARKLRGGGLDAADARITIKRVRREDWAESWKRHFKPIAIGSSLLIKPSWSQRRANQGQAVVVLDPGLSFGTGQHPTTLFCLQQLAARLKSGHPKAFLDLGTGSGILAIAAAKLGYHPILAIDVDPEAIRVARGNARQNNATDRVRIKRQDLAALSGRSSLQFDLICANLNGDVLVRESERIAGRLHPEGRLVLAGILGREFSRVQRQFARAGLKLVASRKAKEWRSGVFGWGDRV